MTSVTAALLRQQDDECSTAVLHLLCDNDAFKRLAASEGEAILRRDKEDEEKLAVGIGIAKAKGILSGNPDVGSVTRISVAGMTAQQVTEEIMKYLPSKKGNAIVMQGLSGTGKGTTVNKLQKLLPRCVTWSNGNVFRSYTYLSLEALKGEPIRTELLTPELLAAVEKQVTFEQVENGGFDIVLKGSIRVADIQNTLLKRPEIEHAVPTVAQQTQGEVIRFATMAVGKLKDAGYNVILEGRAQTLNHIPTPFRFELVIDNITLLGERRAAQRVMAKAFSDIKNHLDGATNKMVEEAIFRALSEL
ncbi:hypothetical protein C3747_45g185 [Trypanosoma cruzi]|uniref:(d)CMP kinase n=2 Tax=Trypanosoma cruzi TaxID=5693 RepID=Q4DGT9_TRYCC|nr:hypothetical protein, conserved [Trypanosoma cruzi]EAN91745.1 hypothetical protein, conserved [Trypanosoma cruzi]PWV13140.1 hypothetical protein C3747_45g185 [Trypanosoma cruzi]RNC42006.1 hypothetical protein TcCL_NonESM08385 [Trypanosoma cruzi]|eukprot:XP_813596.1 hypothetical protein [Trypanosoma cruzi strain CL Brener]